MSATLRERRNLTDGYRAEVALRKAAHGVALAILKLLLDPNGPGFAPGEAASD